MLTRDECGRRIKLAREKKGLTQSQAAQKLQVERPSYAQYESGRRVPSWIVLYQMIETLDLEPGLIFSEYVRHDTVSTSEVQLGPEEHPLPELTPELLEKMRKNLESAGWTFEDLFADRLPHRKSNLDLDRF